MIIEHIRRLPSWLRIAFFVTCVVASALIWLRLTYPKFSHINLSVSRSKALQIAFDYMNSKNLADLSAFKHAIVFEVDNNTDQYLQKSLGYEKAESFIQEHQYDLFYWSIRFFQESKKEEFRVAVNSNTGKVISYKRILDESAARKEVDQKSAEVLAKNFLIERFHFDPESWQFNSKTDTKFDNRVEYAFTWEKKNVYVPWDPDPKNGGGKLLATVVISGDEILAYSKQLFSIPEMYSRYVERFQESGRNLGLISNIGGTLFVLGAIWVIVVRRNHLTMNATKKFYIYIIAGLFILSIFASINNAQGYIYSYPTTQPYLAFFIRQVIYEVLDRFLFFVRFIIPCLAGELLRFEVFPRKSELSIFRYVSSSFFTRDVARIILLGYCLAVIMVGLQSLIFEFGQQHWDVWMERGRLSRLSTGYFPFLGVLMIAVNASISEESFYRLFGINASFKFFRNAALGILIPSIIWGLGHTGYIVFPFWFRGLEVTLLGIFISLVYLRYGIICVVIIHYVFDAFWASAPYVFGMSSTLDFWMSLGVIFLPLVWAMIAFCMNRPEGSRKVDWQLNKNQRFNLDILKVYLNEQRQKPAFNPDGLRKQLISLGWDIGVVDVAFRDLDLKISGEHTLSDP